MLNIEAKESMSVVWFYKYSILGNADSSTVKESGFMVAWGSVEESSEERIRKWVGLIFPMVLWVNMSDLPDYTL